MKTIQSTSDYYNHVLENVVSATDPENRVLGARVKAGDEAARAEMIERNLRLAFKFGRPYTRWFSEDDVYQEAVIGLMDAVAKYDPALGKFAGFARRYIRSRVSRAMNEQKRMIKLPKDKLTSLIKYCRNQEVDESAPEEIRRLSDLERVVELDAPADNGDGDETIANLVHGSERSADQAAILAEVMGALETALQRYPDTAREIVRLTLAGNSGDDIEELLGADPDEIRAVQSVITPAVAKYTRALIDGDKTEALPELATQLRLFDM